MEALDQAETLRKLMTSRQSESEGSDGLRSELGSGDLKTRVSQKLRVFTFSSGIDPEGKRDFVQQLNQACLQDGFRTLLLDECVTSLDAGNLRELIRESRDLDYVFVNMRPGLQTSSLEMHHPLNRSVVVMTPDPASMTDAFGLVKLLSQSKGVRRFHVVVNQVTDPEVAQKIFNKFCQVVDRFLDVELTYLGYGKFSENIRHSVLNKKYLLDLKEDTFVSVEG